MSLQITNEIFENQILSSEKPVLIDFWATWCGPCKMIAPIIDELSEELSDKVLIGKIDVDAQPELAQKFGVMSIPTLIILENGKEVNRVVGFKSKDQIKALLKV